MIGHLRITYLARSTHDKLLRTSWNKPSENIRWFSPTADIIKLDIICTVIDVVQSST